MPIRKKTLCYASALVLGLGLAVAGITLSYAQGTGGPGGAGGPGNATTGGMNTNSGNTMSAPSTSGSSSNSGMGNSTSGMSNGPAKTDPKKEK